MSYQYIINNTLKRQSSLEKYFPILATLIYFPEITFGDEMSLA